MPPGGRAHRRSHHLPQRRLCSIGIARPRSVKKRECAGRTRLFNSRHAERARLTFAPATAGGFQRRAPSGGRSGGSTAQQGRQGGCAARHTHLRPAQCSGWPVRALHGRPPGSSSPLLRHSPSTLASLMRLALAQSTTVTTTTASEIKSVDAVGFGSILVASEL